MVKQRERFPCLLQGMLVCVQNVTTSLWVTLAHPTKESEVLTYKELKRN